MKPYAELEKVCSLCCTKHVSEISTIPPHGGKWREIIGNKRTVPRIRTNIAYVGLDLINCVLIFLAFILFYSFCRLLCCWPWWGDIFAWFFCCHKIYSLNFPASPPPTKAISAPCRTSLLQQTRLHVKRSFGKRFTKVRRILCENDRTSVDPLLSGNWALVIEPSSLNEPFHQWWRLRLRAFRKATVYVHCVRTLKVFHSRIFLFTKKQSELNRT